MLYSRKELVLIAFMGLVLTSCATLTPSGLAKEPKNYLQKEVSIEGMVTALVTIPFTDIRLFLLSDKVASVPVVSTKAPRTDVPVTLKAWVAGFAVPVGQWGESEQRYLRDKLVELGILKDDVSDVVAGLLIAALKGLGSASERLYILVDL